MIKEHVDYKDFNGQLVSEDLYFHLTRAEMVELETSEDGGVGKAIEEISKSQNVYQVIPYIKKFLLAGYGVRSADGRSFTKSEALRNAFQTTEAYSALFMSISSDAGKAERFFNGLVPEGFNQDPTGTGAPLTPRQISEQQMQGYRKPQASTQEPKLADPVDVTFPDSIESAPVQQNLTVDPSGPLVPGAEPIVSETPEQKRARLWAELEAMDNQ